MTSRSRSIAAVAALVACTACGGGVKVSSDWNPNTDFSGFETYMWIPDDAGGSADGAGQSANPIWDQRIREAIENELNSKGFKKVGSGGDLAVGYQVTTSDNVSYQTVSTGWGSGWGRAGWGGYGGVGMSTSSTQAIHTTVGTLIIAVFDGGGSHSLLWHGNGQSNVDPNLTPEARTENINYAVTKILESFPPDASNSN